MLDGGVARVILVSSRLSSREGTELVSQTSQLYRSHPQMQCRASGRFSPGICHPILLQLVLRSLSHSQGSGFTALHVAAMRNDPNTIRVLLNMKVDVNSTNVRRNGLNVDHLSGYAWRVALSGTRSEYSTLSGE